MTNGSEEQISFQLMRELYVEVDDANGQSTPRR
jgi:hypothetical protein